MLDRILELLESLSKRPQMYVHPVEVATIQSFLNGLEAGCYLAGLTISHETRGAAAASRGWKFRATGIVWHMKEKQLTDEQIIHELITVEVEAFRLAAEGPEKGTGKGVGS